MEAAKVAVDKIIHRGGRHDTHVEETVNPAVTRETVKPTRHEHITEAVDKEVHQDHYHTTVQPIQHREVLPERHQHQQLPTQQKEYRHGDDSQIGRSVAAESAQFKDTTRAVGTTHTQSHGPAVVGEHVHHHVHENVQPVIHKETIAPEVVHTTVPVHERHQAPSEHHGMSVLPTKTLDEVKNLGHSLADGTRREEHYTGDPKQYDKSMQIGRTDVDKNFGQHDGLHTPSSSSKTGVGSTAAGTSASGGAMNQLAGSHERNGATGGASRSTFKNTNTEDSTNSSEGNELVSDHGNNPALQQSTRNESSIKSHHQHSHHPLTPSTSDMKHQDHKQGLTSRIGHGITNQIHHGTERDNIDRNTTTDDTNFQHGTQSRDPAVIDERSKKLTGTGLDGSHSALFGLTPDGHKHEDTSHGVSKLRPAHSKDISGTRTEPERVQS